MIHTLLSWQARAAGETRRVAPWKRSIHSIISEEQGYRDSAPCVLKSAHLTSAAANPLTSCSQQLATLAREVTMPMPRANAFVWWTSVALGPAAHSRLDSAGAAKSLKLGIGMYEYVR